MASPASAEGAAPAASSFVVAESAVRVLDTRSGVGVPMPAVIANGTTVTVDLSAQVPTGTTAVTLNVTGISVTKPTFVRVWQAGTPRPVAASINLRAHETRANTVTVPVGPDRKVNFYNHNGGLHLVADLVGRYGSDAASWYNPVTPQRFLNTKATGDPFHGGTARTVSLAGRVPPGTTAVVVNVTAVAPTRDTYLSVTGTITGRPSTSSLNVVAGETTPNLVTVAVSEELNIAVWNNSGTVDVLADLVGYYSPDEGQAFYPMNPVRRFDSRPTSLAPGSQRQVWVDGVVPADATAVLLNLTGVANSQATFLTTWPSGHPRPGTSTLNLTRLQIASNHSVVPLGAAPTVEVYNHSGYTDIIVDVAGYFGAQPA